MEKPIENERQKRRQNFNFSLTREIASVWNLFRDYRDTPARWISRDDTIPIPTANQPTEDEGEGGEGGGRGVTETEELQKAYLATSSGKEEEEEAEALPVVPAACDRARCRHNKGERFKQ